MEEAGALDDASEMAQAHARHPSEQSRMLERARLLARRLGLQADWERLRAGLWIAGALLLVLAYLLAGGLLTRVLGSGQTVNAAFAFVAMLGVPSLALLVWLLWALASAFSRGASAPWSLGQAMLSLAARIPGLRGPHTLTLLRALHATLREQRLDLWVFGAISHALWALALGLVLVTLLLLFSFQAFQLTWETTILDARFFERFLAVTGWLPGQLGFPVPAQALVHAPPSASGSQAIAWWLLASALLYGLLPRVAALGVCLAVWHQRASRLALDTRDPHFRRLVARFAAMAPAPVVDAEHAAPRPAGPGFRALAPGQGARTVLIGFELPDELAAPPAELLALADQAHTIRGSMTERLALLGALAAEPGADALVLCCAAASPDRGAERFLRQIGEQTASCALLPLALDAAGTDNKPQRWADWLLASGLLPSVTFCATLEDARHWLETHRG